MNPPLGIISPLLAWRRRFRALHGAAAVAGLAILPGCADRQPASTNAGAAASASAQPAIPEVLATIGTERITLGDIRARVGDELDRMDVQYQAARHLLIDTTLQAVVRDRVLTGEAKRQGKTVDQILAAEIGGPLDPSPAEVDAWYAANKPRLGDRTLEQIRPQIAQFLSAQRRGEAAGRIEARVGEQQKVAVHLTPFKLPLTTDGAPAMGPANAPVTLVEFSDFECPFCGRFHGTLNQLATRFGDRLRIVYKQFPIPSLHPAAFKAAEASLCAHDQGKFWQMHDAMFQEQGRNSVAELKAKAQRLGLDAGRFNACLDAGRYAEQVQNDLREGVKVGITGTPALFVNGVEIPGGAVSMEMVAQTIERELARLKR